MKLKNNSSNKMELSPTEESYYDDKFVSCVSELEQNKIAILIYDVDFIGLINRNTK